MLYNALSLRAASRGAAAAARALVEGPPRCEAKDFDGADVGHEGSAQRQRAAEAVQQAEAESRANTRPATLGDALSAQLAGARGPIREERTGYVGAALTRPFGPTPASEHAARLAAQKKRVEEEARRVLTTPGKRRQKTSYTAARLHSSSILTVLAAGWRALGPQLGARKAVL